MSHTPLVLAPIRSRPAFPVGADLDPDWLADWPATMRLAVTVNLLGLPAVAIPYLTRQATPISHRRSYRSSARAFGKTSA